MLETAKKEGYAYPAVNVTTIEVINGALRAFSEAKSDGIIQVSIGGGKFASGTSIGNPPLAPLFWRKPRAAWLKSTMCS